MDLDEDLAGSGHGIRQDFDAELLGWSVLPAIQRTTAATVASTQFARLGSVPQGEELARLADVEHLTDRRARQTAR